MLARDKLLARFVLDVKRIVPARGATHFEVDTVPDGTSSLLFRWFGGDRADIGVRGPMTRAYSKIAPAVPLVVRVQFRPGGAYPFFGVPIDALVDRVVSLEDLWGRDAGRLLERLASAAAGSGDVGRVLENALSARLRERPFEPPSAMAARAAVRAIDEGRSSIEDAARAIGISERHLRRSFRATVGLSPKTYARIARFQRALARGREARRWGEVALAVGYYDQAHLNADFRDLALRSPRGARADVPRASCP